MKTRVACESRYLDHATVNANTFSFSFSYILRDLGLARVITKKIATNDCMLQLLY
jgi:hypothetical protein